MITQISSRSSSSRAKSTVQHRRWMMGIQIQDSDFRLRFWIWFRFQIQIQIADSDFRFRFQIQISDFWFGSQIQIYCWCCCWCCFIAVVVHPGNYVVLVTVKSLPRVIWCHIYTSDRNEQAQIWYSTANNDIRVTDFRNWALYHV